MKALDFLLPFVNWCAKADLPVDKNSLCEWLLATDESTTIIRSWASFHPIPSAVVTMIDKTHEPRFIGNLMDAFVNSARNVANA